VITYGIPVSNGVFWVIVDGRRARLETQGRKDSSETAIEVDEKDVDKILMTLKRVKRYLEITHEQR